MVPCERLVSVNVKVDTDEANIIEKILEIGDRIRSEYGISVHITVESSISFDPLVGWVHSFALGEDDASANGINKDEYMIMRNGARISVIFDGKPSEDKLEDAILEATLEALSMHVVTISEDVDHLRTSGHDPGSFAAGEHLVQLNAAM